MVSIIFIVFNQCDKKSFVSVSIVYCLLFVTIGSAERVVVVVMERMRTSHQRHQTSSNGIKRTLKIKQRSNSKVIKSIICNNKKK